MSVSRSPRPGAPAQSDRWISRVTENFDDVGDAVWDSMQPDMFYLSARWLRSSGSTLSSESGFITVCNDGGPPVAALASYLLRAPTYIMLDPPELVVAEYLQRDLNEFLEPSERHRLGLLSRRLRPRLSERYPVAVCVTPYGFTSAVMGHVDVPGIASLLVAEFRQLAQRWAAKASSFLFIADDDQPALTKALRAAGYSSMTLGAHCVLPITAGSFAEYTDSLAAGQRRVRRELRQFAKSGLRPEVVSGGDISELLDELAVLYARHVRKYGGTDDIHWAMKELRWIDERFADVSRVCLVRDGERIVSFCWLFEANSALYRYISGQTYDRRARESSAYFFSSFHAPAQLAIDHGIARIEGGTESYEAKVRRGYRLRPVSGFFDFGSDLKEDLDEFTHLIEQAQRARLDSYAPPSPSPAP
jgi:predicted N-acyltransferase